MTAKQRYEECPESVSGHDFSGRKDGKCSWCLAKVGIAERRPSLGKPQAEIEADYWYNRMYNPDDEWEW